MVWAGITSTGKTPLVFIDRNVKINAANYQDVVLKNALHPWAQNHFKNKPWTLQQDWAPAHSAKSSIKICKELFSNIWEKDIWPPNSPDLNPMDYSVWSILETKVCSKRYATVEQLKNALLKAWDEITVEQLTTIVDNFPKRLNACIKSRGSNFEN